MSDIAACPFCGRPASDDLSDTSYPSATTWKWINRETGLKAYGRHNDPDADGRCWEVNCPVSEGGCGAEIHGDSEVEAIAAWNRRAPAPQEDALPALPEPYWPGFRPSLDSQIDLFTADQMQDYARAALAARDESKADAFFAQRNQDAQTELLELRSAAKELWAGLCRQQPDIDGTGNGPGHGHSKPGVWDDTGEPCSWCVTWIRFCAAIDAAKGEK